MTLKDDNYYKNLDKRTREYKDYISLKKAQEKVLKDEDSKINGLGDAIAKVTEVTGIAKVVKTISKDCGCDERHEKANSFLSIRTRAVKCIDDVEDFNYLKSFFSTKRSRINAIDQVRLIGIYNDVFGKNAMIPSCATCSARGFMKNVNKLKNYYNAVVKVMSKEDKDEI